MTPEGDDEQPDDANAPDLGWGDAASAQPPGERIQWETQSTTVTDGGSSSRPTPFGGSAAPRAETVGPQTSGPGNPTERPAPRFGPPPGADPTPARVRAPQADAGREDRASTPAPPAVHRPEPTRSAPGPVPAWGNPSQAADEPSDDDVPTMESDPPARPSTLRGTVPAPGEPFAPRPAGTPAPRAGGFAFEDVATIGAEAEPGEADEERAARPRTPDASSAIALRPDVATRGRDEDEGQLSALAQRAAAAAEKATAERRADREALTELAQQLAAAQTQIAAIGSQLTTLSHRISYDLERSAQTTSERILRGLSDLPSDVSLKVGSDLGPVIDDLTDQVETDLGKITTAVAGVQDGLARRLAAMGEIVDGLPLSNVEILSSISSVSTDLEDHLSRFATRVNDQISALERSHAAELTRLRTQLDDLRVASGRGASTEAFERMAGQVERMAQRAPGGEDVVESLELLVSEHLDVLRDNIDARVGGLGPILQEELDAIRTEALGGLAATEEGLVERLEVLEASFIERLDVALGDQVDALDAVIAERQAELLASRDADADEGGIAAELAEVAAGNAARFDELSEVVTGNATRFDELAEVVTGTSSRFDELSEVLTGTNQRLDEVTLAVAELREAVESGAGAPTVITSGDGEGDGGAAIAEALGAVSAELKALKRRISLRAGGDEAGGLTPEQVAALAAQIADHLH